ncbi:MAG: S-layer homology domain-containing protein [Clostridia bacterium]|nr:S-layer homology domain-containing protein [Clostridia bacterium]
MKAIKRTVAALLATLMLATSTSFTLAAEEYSDKEAVVVAKVNAAGIMTGTDKGFEPSKSLTRAEAAAIIVRMKGISESAVKTAAGTTLFNDVAASHWASGYVNQASNLGIVKGVSATEFAPDREVTVAEFTTMAVRALGAGQLVDSEGTWPSNYVNFANENKILDDVNAIYTAVATRLQAATIVANTLKTVMWEKSGVKTNGEITWQKTQSKDTILDDVLDIAEINDVQVTAVDYKNNKLTLWIEDTNEDGVVDPTETSVEKVVDRFDLSSVKLGYTYDGYYDRKNNKVLGLWTAEDTKIESVEFSEITKVGSDYIRVMVNGEEKEFDVKGAYTTYYNTVKEADNSKVVKSEDLFGTIAVKDDEVKTIYLEQYVYAGAVKEVTDTRVKFETLTGNTSYADASTFKLDDEDLTYFVVKDGKAIDVKDIEEDDVVFYYMEGTKVFHVFVTNDIIEGKVTSVGASYIKLDGTKYTVVTSTTPAFSAASFSTDTTVEAYLNKAGKIVAFKVVEGAGKYAVVSSIEFVKNNKDVVKANIKLAYTDGTESDVMELKLDSKTANAVTSLEKLFVDNDSATGIQVDKDTTHTDYEYSIAPADYDNVKTLNSIVKNNFYNTILGKAVDYNIEGGKLVLLSNAKIGSEQSSMEYVAGSSKNYFKDGSSNITYINDSTKVLAVKLDSDDKYKAVVKAVDVDAMSKQTGLKVTFIDVDAATKVAKVAIINEESGAKVSKGASTGKWAVVTDVTTSVSTDADYKYEVTVITSDNKEVVYNSDVDYTGSYGELVLNGDEISDFTTDDYAPVTLGSLYVAKEEDGVLYLVADNAAENTFAKTYVLADDVVYVELDGSASGEASVGKASAIDNVDVDLSDLYDATNATEIAWVLTYAEESGAPEVVAIAYIAK